MTYSAVAIRDALMNAINTDGLTCSPGAKRRCNSPESCKVLADSVYTKLKANDYTEEDVLPAILMSTARLCSDWKGLDKLTDIIVDVYSAAVPASGKEKGKDGQGENPAEEDREGKGQGQGEDGDGEGQGEGGDQPEKEDKDKRGLGGEFDPTHREDGEEGEVVEGGEPIPEPVPVPVPQPRVPEPDGYLKPENYDLVKDLVQDGFKVMLVGPRGTGKTEMALRIFSELERRLYMLTSPQTRYEVTGYADANGVEVPTQITQAITDPQGGLLLEEMDRSMPEALIPMNAMLANGVMDVPVRGMVKVEPTLAIIATANTNGHGRTEEYGTAQRLDASTLDRFVVVHVGYDRAIDEACAVNAKGKVDNRLVDFITDYRKVCLANGLGEYTVSYRGVRNIKKLADKHGIRAALELALVKDCISKDDLATICGAMKCRNAYANELKVIQEAMPEE